MYEYDVTWLSVVVAVLQGRTRGRFRCVVMSTEWQEVKITKSATRKQTTYSSQSRVQIVLV